MDRSATGATAERVPKEPRMGCLPFSFNRKKKAAEKAGKAKRASAPAPRRVKAKTARESLEEVKIIAPGLIMALALAGVRAAILEKIYCEKFDFTTADFANHASDVVDAASALVAAEEVPDLDVPLSALAALDEGFDDLAGVAGAGPAFERLADAVAAVAAAVPGDASETKRRALRDAAAAVAGRLGEYGLGGALDACLDRVSVEDLVLAEAPTPAKTPLGKRRTSSSDFLDAVFS